MFEAAEEDMPDTPNMEVRGCRMWVVSLKLKGGRYSLVTSWLDGWGPRTWVRFDRFPDHRRGLDAVRTCLETS